MGHLTPRAASAKLPHGLISQRRGQMVRDFILVFHKIHPDRPIQ